MDFPPISPWLLGWFRWYSRRYLRRFFHAIRLSKPGLPPIPAGKALVVFLNHGAWWDPLVGLFLADHFFPTRRHYTFVDAKALGRYKFFEKLGCVGIDPHSLSDARKFLRTSLAILRQPDTTLWITPQGRFADPRERPLRFQHGLAHLALHIQEAVFVPLALEFPFWEEKTPESLVRFGVPVLVQGKPGLNACQWNTLLEDRLQAVLDTLAEQSIQRNPDSFEILLKGSAGVGGIYDLWHHFRAWWGKGTYRPEHGGPRR